MQHSGDIEPACTPTRYLPASVAATRILHAYGVQKHRLFVGLMCLLMMLIPLSSSGGVALLYHHVSDTTPPITSISPAQFKRHLEILSEQGFRVVTLDELLRESRTGDGMAKIVAITFDDAYRSIYETAFPLLKRRSWPFTVFVATDAIQNDSQLFLSWEELREMSEHGAHIAGHSSDHSHLIRVHDGESHRSWRKRVKKSINDGQTELARHGFESDYFAYPYGEYNLEIMKMVKADNLTAFGQQSGAIGPDSDLQLLPRFPMTGSYSGDDAFKDKILSLPLPVKHPMIEPLVEEHWQPILSLSPTNKPIDARKLQCFGPGGRLPVSENSDGDLLVKATEPVPVGRSRYNCTLPIGNRHYWFSQMWIRKLDADTWYAEP